MHSYSLSTSVTDEIPEDWIKSLSDDDDDEKDFDEFYYTAAPHHQQSALTAAVEPMSECESIENTATMGQDGGIDEYEQHDDNLLDQDIAIIELLTSRGYKSLSKLCLTEQGSVWRGKSPAELGARCVVIKIASKLHYKQSSSPKEEEEDNKKSEHEDIVKEIKLLQHLNKELSRGGCKSPHLKDNIIRVLDTMETSEHYMVVLEDGGVDLFHFISKVHQDITNKKVTIAEWQKSVKLIGRKILELIEWLHSELLCHSDVSLENILISNVEWITYPDQYKHYKKRLSPNFELKLIDFGAAQSFRDQKPHMCPFSSCSVVCKPLYCCPDIYKLQNKQSTKAYDARQSETWAFGVLYFIMAVGCPPWTVPDDRNPLFQTIVLQRNLDFVLKAWNRSNYMDESQKQMLRQIFVIDAAQRISAQDAIKQYF